MATKPPHHKRYQSAMEFLGTYGWSILIVSIVLVVLYSFGVFRLGSSSLTSCAPISGFSCVAPVIYSSGELSTGFGSVVASKPITIIGVNCSTSKTISGSFMPLVPNVTLSNGQQVRLTFLCPLQLTNPIGTTFSGYLSIKYTQQGSISPVEQVVGAVRGAVSGQSPQAGTVWVDQGATTSGNWGDIASSASGQNVTGVQNYGGIWVSHNYGYAGSWSETSAPHDGSEDWWAIASSANGQVLEAAISGGTIYNSINGGTTWHVTSAPSEAWYAMASSSNGQIVAAVVAGGGIYTSSNYGTTWTLTSAPSEQWEAIASSADGSHLVAGGQGTDIYTSTNGGQTWVDHGGTTNYNWIAAASSADGSRISLVNSSGTQPYSGVWTSTNGGSTWFDPVMASTPQAIASSADGTKMVMVVASGDIFTTNNSGQTWVDAGGSTYNSWWWDVASSSDGTHLVAVAQAGGDIWTSNT